MLEGQGRAAKCWEFLGISTGYAGADVPLLRGPAGVWVGWFVTGASALPPSRDQSMDISDFVATELVQLLRSRLPEN